MSIPFTCPHCGAQTNVSDEYAGQSGPCANCGQTITIPRLEHKVVDLAADRRRTTTNVILALSVVLVLIILICAFVLLPMVERTREATRKVICTENLQRIGQALLAYRARYGGFPPSYLADEQGRPVHSWRVLLLPYLDEEKLFSQYNLKELWNSPRNSALAQRMPAIYHCPSDLQDEDSGIGQVSYLAVVGPGTVFDGVKPENFPGGPSEVIMLVESAASGINWLKPRDLDVNQMSMKVNDPAIHDAVRSNHSHGANVLTCDGQVQFLDQNTDSQVLEDMLSISGGERAWLTPRNSDPQFPQEKRGR
jgi:prepilin-type processing-associated H-X9-DG protein